MRFFVKSYEEAAHIFKEEICKKISPVSVSYGDSETFFETGLREWLITRDEIDYIDIFEAGIAFREKIRRMRSALTVDLFVTGCNAITEKGQLVNLDMIGNRVGGINFGPRYVVLFVQTSKIKNNLESAMDHVRKVVAPANAKRHSGIQTPCKVTGECSDCNSPARICNQWLITEKSHPTNRIKVILLNLR